MTKKEVDTIKSRAARVFASLAHKVYIAYQSGRTPDLKFLYESFNYLYVLSLYDFDKQDNFLKECEVQNIYSRLREIDNV